MAIIKRTDPVLGGIGIKPITATTTTLTKETQMKTAAPKTAAPKTKSATKYNRLAKATRTAGAARRLAFRLMKLTNDWGKAGNATAANVAIQVTNATAALDQVVIDVSTLAGIGWTAPLRRAAATDKTPLVLAPGAAVKLRKATEAEREVYGNTLDDLWVDKVLAGGKWVSLKIGSDGGAFGLVPARRLAAR